VSDSTLRASEVGSYIYCRRAWWYERQGVASQHPVALQEGAAWHRSQGRKADAAGCLRLMGAACLLAAALLAAIFLTGLLVSP
jgi:hypothetical protein